MSLIIKDRGRDGGSADHNWMFLTLKDNFVKKKRVWNNQQLKPKWKISEDQDWSLFQEAVRKRIQGVPSKTLSVDELESLVSSTLLSAGIETIGQTAPKTGAKSKPILYPRHIVDEIKLNRLLESQWKTGVADGAADVVSLEEKSLKQKQKVDDILFCFVHKDRGSIVKECKGGSPKARRCFWNHMSSKVKLSNVLAAVVDPESGVLKCTCEEIKTEVEKHLCTVFQGSMDPIVVDQVVDYIARYRDQNLVEHSYSSSPRPQLPKINDSGDIMEDPGGWLDKVFKPDEIIKSLKQMKGGRTKGWDNIPNEFLTIAPQELLELITILFSALSLR